MEGTHNGASGCEWRGALRLTAMGTCLGRIL